MQNSLNQSIIFPDIIVYFSLLTIIIVNVNIVYQYSILFSCDIIVYWYTRIDLERKEKEEKKIKKKEKESVKHYHCENIIKKT